MNRAARYLLITFAFLVLLELLLRVGGYFYLSRSYLAALRGLNPAKDGVNIVCLGESSTAGLWVKWEESYPMQLQDKLRKLYASEKINIMVPVHVGQNTSQMANRINQYLELYKPKLLIIMAGCNNEWSLAESHVLRFLAHDDLETLKVKAMLFLDNFRIFKLAKYLYLKLANKGIAEYLEQNRYYFLGPPEICRFPPEKWVYSFAIRDQQAFRRLWRYDIRMIIEAAKAKNVRVLLMTYHINPAYLPVREFLDMSDNEHVALIRNDLSFIELAGRNELGGFILQDGWHPNSKGYSLIANNAFCGIRDNDLLGLNAKASGYLSKYER